MRLKSTNASSWTPRSDAEIPLGRQVRAKAGTIVVRAPTASEAVASERHGGLACVVEADRVGQDNALREHGVNVVVSDRELLNRDR